MDYRSRNNAVEGSQLAQPQQDGENRNGKTNQFRYGRYPYDVNQAQESLLVEYQTT